MLGFFLSRSTVSEVPGYNQIRSLDPKYVAFLAGREHSLGLSDGTRRIHAVIESNGRTIGILTADAPESKAYRPILVSKTENGDDLIKVKIRALFHDVTLINKIYVTSTTITEVS